MDYAHLTDSDRDALRAERILELEAQHYRISLVLSETTDPQEQASLRARLDALTERIARHQEAGG